MDPAKMDERIEARVKRMLKRVDATEEQRAKVSEIAKKAAADLGGGSRFLVYVSDASGRLSA